MKPHSISEFVPGLSAGETATQWFRVVEVLETIGEPVKHAVLEACIAPVRRP
ncbi:MAG TPA: hypothetical protein P5318_19085 [Candidatus Hydrogenedentes bacterium]|nr:hypothetical protein [Candidatus Hydrogenedentota bacterium]HRT22220.1 hypothetical protein [Candidatus Hydrogenedentota bacterium]HRT67041.1 hypothetical protein [Candidatus Hydrogenedentota bacterium]